MADVAIPADGIKTHQLAAATTRQRYTLSGDHQKVSVTVRTGGAAEVWFTWLGADGDAAPSDYQPILAGATMGGLQRPLDPSIVSFCLAPSAATATTVHIACEPRS